MTSGATSKTTTIVFTSTSLQGITGASTPATFNLTGSQTKYTVAAVLTEAATTVTAFEVAGTTGLAVVDGTTLTWRHEGITLANGDVVSLGFNGLEDKTTTAEYMAITVSNSSTSTTKTKQTGAGGTKSTTPSHSLTSIKGTHHTSGTKATSKPPGGTGATGAASSSSTGVAPTLAAGKALALLGALGGMAAYAL